MDSINDKPERKLGGEALPLVAWLVVWVAGCVLFAGLLELKGGWLMLGGVATWRVCGLVALSLEAS